jgi:hypothetical protein
LTLACLQTPASIGNPLHYFTGVPGLYPGTTASAPLVLPPGTLSGIFPSGTTLDLVQAMFDGIGNLLGLSNVVPRESLIVENGSPRDPLEAPRTAPPPRRSIFRCPDFSEPDQSTHPSATADERESP